jgi:hypothetical protein
MLIRRSRLPALGTSPSSSWLRSTSAAAFGRATRPFGLGAVFFLAFVWMGCGNPRLEFIAGIAGAAGSGGAAGAPADAAPPVTAQALVRGRVRVAGTSVVTDRGTLLRGIDIPIDLTPDIPLEREMFQELALIYGLNAVQVYVEYWAQDSGSNAAQADRIVKDARDAGLYVILGIGGGFPGNGHLGNGWFDINKVRSFWQFYGPRYKDEPHVIFQIQNQPELSCDVPWQDATYAMEREAYTLVRSVAPETHVILFSYRNMPTASLLGTAIDQVSDLVDWSNASVGMGAIPNCVTTAQFADTFAAAASHRAPVITIGLTLDGDWAANVLELEKNHVGWTSIRWLVRMPDLTTFQAEHDLAGLSWCPDFGFWPQDPTMCGTR